MYRPASEREAAATIISAMNAMSSRFEVASHDEWAAIELVSENLFAVLEAMGFSEDMVETDRDGSFVLLVR